MEELRFSLKRKAIRLVLEDEEGKERVYFVRELTGADREEYMELLAEKMSFDEKGLPTNMRSFKGVMSDLLKRAIEDEDGKRIAPAIVDNMPSDVQTKIYQAAQKLSGLDKESASNPSEGAAKDSGGTESQLA